MHTATIKFDDFGFLNDECICGSFDGAFIYDYHADEITAIYLDGGKKQKNRWRFERTFLKPDHKLWDALSSELLERYQGAIDHATPQHIQARNQRNQDALRTIALNGVRTC